MRPLRAEHRVRRAARLAAATLWVAACSAGEPTGFEARAIEVVDGDSLVVDADGRREELRLFSIDAPEGRQPHGPESRRALVELLGRGSFRVEPIERDRYGRLVADLYVGDDHVNRRMVADGHAWVYERFARDPTLKDLERRARSERRGLWALPESERLPPWAWRAAERSGRGVAERRRPAASAQGRGGPPAERPAVCGSKERCREMSSCEEAMFFLRECGSPYLDGDGDGVPCEVLCRPSAPE